ncbi:MAG TPA: DUF3592 domain-containing protein [Rhizomicrobium sp.]|jgi:hypothetical protein
MSFPPLKPADPFALLLFLGAGAFICLRAIVIWLHRARLARKVEGWRIAEGEILSTGITPYATSDDDHHEACVHYRYRVSGQVHEGRRFRVGPEKLVFSQHSKALEALAPYRKGIRVKVSYDPAQPDRSVLEPMVASNGLMVPAIGGGLMVVFAILASLTLR